MSAFVILGVLLSIAIVGYYFLDKESRETLINKHTGATIAMVIAVFFVLYVVLTSLSGMSIKLF